MATDIRLKETLPEITESIVATYTECSRTSHLGHKPLPSRDTVVDIITDLMDVLFPGYWRRQNLHIGNVEYHVGDLIDRLDVAFTRYAVSVQGADLGNLDIELKLLKSSLDEDLGPPPQLGAPPDPGKRRA